MNFTRVFNVNTGEIQCILIMVMLMNKGRKVCEIFDIPLFC